MEFFNFVLPMLSSPIYKIALFDMKFFLVIIQNGKDKTE